MVLCVPFVFRIFKMRILFLAVSLISSSSIVHPLLFTTRYNFVYNRGVKSGKYGANLVPLHFFIFLQEFSESSTVSARKVGFKMLGVGSPRRPNRGFADRSLRPLGYRAEVLIYRLGIYFGDDFCSSCDAGIIGQDDIMELEHIPFPLRQNPPCPIR